MLSILAIIAAIVFAAIVVIAIVASHRPDSFRVERSAVIAAPPERLQPMISDLRTFNEWNPYRRKDPGMKEEYGTATAGPGATYAWDSSQVGAGRMTVETVAPDRVTMRLDFARPFKATNLAEFTLRPEGNGTRVTWAMRGRANFVSKVMQVFMDFDAMIGNDFADGLANLRTLAERR